MTTVQCVFQHGRNALDIADRYGKARCADRLREAGAQLSLTYVTENGRDNQVASLVDERIQLLQGSLLEVPVLVLLFPPVEKCCRIVVPRFSACFRNSQ